MAVECTWREPVSVVTHICHMRVVSYVHAHTVGRPEININTISHHGTGAWESARILIIEGVTIQEGTDLECCQVRKFIRGRNRITDRARVVNSLSVSQIIIIRYIQARGRSSILIDIVFIIFSAFTYFIFSKWIWWEFSKCI